MRLDEKIQRVGNVVINYSFYTGTDEYSDGDIEDDILKMVQNEEDVIKILRADNRCPVLYHLSPVRQNILKWYPFEKQASVLEIGSGCGAVTGAICQNCNRVVCVDLSNRRSLINANRNKRYDNLEIIVGNFNDIVLKEKFDYITLIGVLEYAAYYTENQNPFVAFLSNVGKYLKPGGKLLIAIENKYGLKYWAGACEDHIGEAFEGLEGYVNTDSKVRTFGKKKLMNILQEAGYLKYEFYYPFPDYKFPVQIFSDEHLPTFEDLDVSREVYDNSRYEFFDEKLVYAGILEEGRFDFFSNSFFVEAAK